MEEIKFYTVEEIAKKLGVYKQNIYIAIQEGKLRALKVGNRRLVIPEIFFKAYVYGLNPIETDKLISEELKKNM